LKDIREHLSNRRRSVKALRVWDRDDIRKPPRNDRAMDQKRALAGAGIGLPRLRLI
jgi:hypothetical protein